MNADVLNATVAGSGDDTRACVCECFDDCPSDAFADAGDDCDLAAQVQIHGAQLRRGLFIRFVTRASQGRTDPC